MATLNDVNTMSSSRSGSMLGDFDIAKFHPLVSWRSVLAGFLVSMFFLAILLSLGMAFGGIGLSDGTTAQRAGIFTGVWFVISTLISLFAGSYFAARISKFHTGRIGSAQGLVIAALFFGVLLFQTMAAIGWAGRTAGVALGGTAAAVSAGAGAAANSDNPAVNTIVQSAVSDLDLKSDPQAVIAGVGSRMVRGDVDGAKNYLASQAGITPAEADRRLSALRAQVDQAVVQAREATAKGLQATGWTLFITMVIGALAAVFGGATGSIANVRRPIAEVEEGFSSAMAGHQV